MTGSWPRGLQCGCVPTLRPVPSRVVIPGAGHTCQHQGWALPTRSRPAPLRGPWPGLRSHSATCWPRLFLQPGCLAVWPPAAHCCPPGPGGEASGPAGVAPRGGPASSPHPWQGSHHSSPRIHITAPQHLASVDPATAVPGALPAPFTPPGLIRTPAQAPGTGAGWRVQWALALLA